MRELNLEEISEISGGRVGSYIASAVVSIAVNEIYRPIRDFIVNDYNTPRSGSAYGGGYSTAMGMPNPTVKYGT